MASTAWQLRAAGPWRFSHRDAVLVTLAAVHGAVIVVLPFVPVIALGVWWNSNTIAHNFIHRPFFRSAALNRLFSAALSVLLGIPQRLWRDRHLAHHAGVKWRLTLSCQLLTETALVLGLWALLAWLEPRFLMLAYVPGYLAGLGLCVAQGYWEHHSGPAVSHYGRLYNSLCFNDGYHAEHHSNPAVHWTELPRHREAGADVSRWPALLRWFDLSPLEILEHLVLRSAGLRRLVLRVHERALQDLASLLPPVRRVTIVGGGLFPRTALILRDLLPGAHIAILDSNARHLATARKWLGDGIEYRHERYVPGWPAHSDLLVIPLCLSGDRAAIYRDPPAAAVLVHDWMWKRRGTGRLVSLMLLKRLNLVLR
ncbi:MAG TPA: fatty acid desaturase [Bryobacteraceae bacterium]|nr:fatty acid desaturase [Bryobacteraceae bacterium]